MDKKNNIPEIRFKGFQEEWVDSNFNKTFNSLSNNTLSRANLNYEKGLAKNIHYGDVLIKFNEILDVQSNIIPFISNNELVDKFRVSKLQNGDVIFADAAEDETVGKCTEIVNVNDEIVYPGLHTIAVRPTFLFASKYLGYYLNSPAYHNQLLRLMQGTKVSSISKSAIKDTSIIHPKDTNEQKQIGTFFQNLDNLITLHRKKYDKLVILKKAMSVKMFTKNGALVPEIRFKGFTDDWDVKRLGDIGNTYTGLSGKTKVDFGHGTGQYVTYMNVFNNPISNTKLTELVEVDNSQNEVNFGDVFFTTSSETPDEVGMSSVWLSNEKNVYLNSFCFGYRLTEKVDNYFLSSLLRSTNFRKKISFLAQGISRYNISKNKVMDISIEIPCTKEQIKIGEYFKNLDKQITLHKIQLDKLNNIKKACFSKMFVAQE